ncbi:MAG: glycosyltransferase family 4 protein [Burkholderiales bacterium]|nr:glycosyltransferase family 4 protein [Burkholderiales bacterium]
MVMAGPLPPGIGGMVTVIEDLSASRLASDIDLVLFDTKKTTPEGRALWQAIVARLKLCARWWAALGVPGTIAHIHTCSGLSYFLDGSLLLLARARGVPVLLHIHGGLFEDFLRALSPAARCIAQFIARRASQVVVLSTGWRDRLAPLLPGARLSIIENGIRLPLQTADRADADVPTILFLGTVSTAKGVEDLIEAIGRLRHPFRLVLVGGEDPPGIGVRLRARATQFRLAGCVEFTGPVYGAAKHDWLRTADIFVLPSHAEALPMALLEAMAHGLAVVASRVGAIPSVVVDERSGLLVDARDVDQIAGALERLLADRELRARFGREAQRVAHARYSVDRAAAELIDLYRKVAA